MVNPENIVPIYLDTGTSLVYADEGLVSLINRGILISSGTILDGALIHGTLALLNEDDHPQYSLVDGTRAYTGNISVIPTVPILDSHLARKDYVDNLVASGVAGVSSLNGLVGIVTLTGVGDTQVTVSGQIINITSSVAALQGSDGITVISGSNITTISGFRDEFVSASGSLQSNISNINYGRREAVTAFVTASAAPPTETSGDRYILDFSGTPDANWDGAVQGDIVEFNGITWDATTPQEGWVAYVDFDDLDILYVDDGVPSWNFRPDAIAGLSDGLISGGASWDTGLTFSVTALEYVVGGNYTTSVSTSVTLTTADPSDPRIDVIVADDTGTISVVTGVPSASPVKPEIGVDQIEVTFATVPAGSTTPAGIVVTDIFLENAGTGGGEWDYTDNSASLDPTSTADPFEGTISIEATSPVTGNQIFLDPAGTHNASADTTLEFKIKTKAGWGNSYLFFRFESPDGFGNGSWKFIRHGTLGFDRTNTSTYQTISVPLSSFNLSNPSSISRLRFYVIKIGGSLDGFFLDRIRVMTGIVMVIGSGNDPNAIHKNISNEISSITEKTALVPGDILIGEDSESSFIKKKFSLSSIQSTISGSAGEVEPAIVGAGSVVVISGSNITTISGSSATTGVDSLTVSGTDLTGNITLSGIGGTTLLADGQVVTISGLSLEELENLKSYGELYEENDAGTNITVVTPGTYVKWTSAAVGQVSTDLTVSGSAANSNLTILENGAGEYLVSHMSAFVSLQTAFVWTTSIFRNGVRVVGSDSQRNPNSTKRSPLSNTSIIRLDPGDVIDLRFNSSLSNRTAVLYRVNLNIARIGRTGIGSGEGGVTDHGDLTGLADDDHVQYSNVDGSRAFTATVGGITPTASGHLTTKDYVDTADVTISGHLQSVIDGIDPDVTLQDAYDNGDGTIVTTAGKPLELIGTGEFVAVTGTFSNSLTISGVPVATGVGTHKTIVIENPGPAEDISFFYTNTGLSVEKVVPVLLGLSDPGVTWTVRHAASRLDTGTELITGGTNSHLGNSEQTINIFDNKDITPNTFVWIETTSQSGSPTELGVTLFGRN